MRLELLKVLFGSENYMNIRPAHFVNIRFTLDNPRFYKRFKGRRDRRMSSFSQVSLNRGFWGPFKCLVEGLVIP